MSEVKKINLLLQKLAKLNDENKGSLGEEIVFEVVKRYQKKRGNLILLRSVSYPYIPHVAGNIKLIDSEYKHFSDSNTEDEVDIIVISSYRIFLIEVKAYRYQVTFTDEWTYRPKGPIEKSIPIQAEKHARHFYYNFFHTLPDGNSNYIIPMIVLADKSTIIDNRNSNMKQYIPITNLNNLNKTISDRDTPLEYELNTPEILKAIKEKSLSINKISL